MVLHVSGFLPELRLTLADRRRAIEPVDSPTVEEFDRRPRKVIIARVPEFTIPVIAVTRKARVVAQIRDFSSPASQELLASKLAEAAPSVPATDTPAPLAVEVPAPQGWSVWRLLGY